MTDAPREPTAVEQAQALRAEYTRQQIAFIDVELTTALTFLTRTATERTAGHLAHAAATIQQAQTAYDEAVRHLAAADLSATDRAPLERRRQDVAERLAGETP